MSHGCHIAVSVNDAMFTSNFLKLVNQLLWVRWAWRTPRRR